MVFEYSFWWIFPAILLALAVAYSKFKKLTKLPDITLGLSLTIASLRFLIVFFLLLLLLNPALSLLHRNIVKPLLVIAQDNSASLIKNKDSLYYLNEYRVSLEEARTILNDKFEVVNLTFGAQIHKEKEIDYTDTRTDISSVFEYIVRNFSVRQPVGMILLSDGIYNSGINPRYKTPAFPVYTVLTGDTTSYPDVYIKGIEADKFNFLNTIFPLKAEVAALKQRGHTIKCILKENGNKIGEKSLKIDQDNFLSEVVFSIEAKRKGVVRYTVLLETESAERTKENNQVETWVNVIDNSANIAVFAEAPHPDLSAIVNAVNVSGMYRCKEHRFTETMDTLKANLIILHNPNPANSGYRQLLQIAKQKKIAIWYILSGKKNMADLASVEKQYSVNFTTDLNEYANISVNQNFPYFEFTEEEKEGFKTYPPLVVPFGTVNAGAGRLLFTQKIKNTSTNNGMIGFYEHEGRRVCYFWGEGLWKWRLFSYQENGNHELFNTLINKIVGYLAISKGDNRFIHDIKPVYSEIEETAIQVELYNDSYELINTPEVRLKLKHEDKNFEYILARNFDKYRINLGNLPAGAYDYELYTNLKGEKFSRKGTFFIQSYNQEANSVVANRQLLQEIAEQSGAQLWEARDLDRLVQILKGKEELKPTFKTETEFVELNKLPLVGLIILLLLCIEWFLLKYFAG